MPHRDDLEAAHARIAALERELAAARKEERSRMRCGRCGNRFAPADLNAANGQLRCGTCASAVDASRPGRRPRGFEVDDTAERLLIRWKWQVRPLEVVGFVLFGFCGIALVAAAASGQDGAVGGVVLLAVVQLMLGLRVVRQVANSTEVRADDRGLTIASGPITIDGPFTLERGDIDQVYCAMEPARYGTWYSLHVQRVGGHTLRLVDEIESAERAFFLEREIERRLGIVDRPVEGEVPRRD